MRSWVLAASILAAAGVTTSAKAADLDEGPPPGRYGSVYDDPRYADIYRQPERPRLPYAGPMPRERVYRDYDEEVVPYAGPRRYSYDDQRYGRCVPREEIRERLMRHGWHGFHDGEVRGDVAVVRARRPSGRLFELSIERCTGEVVSAYPLEARPFGSFAFRQRPWWHRSY